MQRMAWTGASRARRFGPSCLALLGTTVLLLAGLGGSAASAKTLGQWTDDDVNAGIAAGVNALDSLANKTDPTMIHWDASGGSEAWSACNRHRSGADSTLMLDDAGTNLRPREILQNRHFAPGPFGCRTHPLEGDGVRFMSAVRKVETDDVGPRIDQRIEDVIGAARRADGRDDFSVPHGGT